MASMSTTVNKKWRVKRRCTLHAALSEPKVGALKLMITCTLSIQRQFRLLALVVAPLVFTSLFLVFAITLVLALVTFTARRLRARPSRVRDLPRHYMQPTMPLRHLAVWYTIWTGMWRARGGFHVSGQVSHKSHRQLYVLSHKHQRAARLLLDGPGVWRQILNSSLGSTGWFRHNFPA
jgi:hypothetical protein